MVQNNEEDFEILTNPLFDELLNKHLKDDAKDLALRYANKKGFPNLLPLWNLLDFYPKLAEKLPQFYRLRCRMPRKAYEQASSEVTANWKAKHFIQSHDVVLNLCAGIGADDVAFAQTAKQIIALETDAFTHACASDALKRMNIQNVIRLQKDAEQFIQEGLASDISLIYADPDRRASGSRSFRNIHYSPDLRKIIPTLLSLRIRILLKLSPMEDWQETAKLFPHVTEVIALASDDEVKELLLFYNPEQRTTQLLAVNLRKRTDVQKHFTNFSSLKHVIPVFAELPAQYLYEAHPTIAKLNMAPQLIHQNRLEALTSNSIFATASFLVEDFFGRTFSILTSFPYQRRKLDLYLKEKNISQANVTKRDFRMEVHEIRKVHQLKDGGDDYFFFYQSKQRKPWVIHARKMEEETFQ